MSLWPQFLKRKKIETPQQLADFIALEADMLTQRTILNYTQALLGRQWKKLIETAEFRAAMHRSRWESYPAILGDFVCIAEAQLRRHAENGRSRADSGVSAPLRNRPGGAAHTAGACRRLPGGDRSISRPSWAAA